MGFFIYLCIMQKKVRVEPMTGIQKMIAAKKMKEQSEEMNEAMMEAMAFRMALMNPSPKKKK